MKKVDIKIIELHNSGCSVRQIADMVFYSKSYVHRIISEQDKFKKQDALVAKIAELEKRLSKLEKH